jgi:hypothetical protein
MDVPVVRPSLGAPEVLQRCWRGFGYICLPVGRFDNSRSTHTRSGGEGASTAFPGNSFHALVLVATLPGRLGLEVIFGEVPREIQVLTCVSQECEQSSLGM